MKLLILDQFQWVNFAACTEGGPVMITGEVSHGILFIKTYLNSNIININNNNNNKFYSTESIHFVSF